MASKDGRKFRKSRKPDLIVPPWEQSDAEAPADDTGEEPGGEPGGDHRSAGDADETDTPGRKGRYSIRKTRGSGGHSPEDTSEDTPKTRERPPKDTGETRARSAATVVMIDGSKLITVGFKAGAVVSVSDQDYDTEIEALRSAAARKGKKLIVWCGPVTARAARPADASEHPDVVRLADARYLANVFGPDRPAVMTGTVAMTPAPHDDALEILNASSARMAVSGMCVNLDEDGIWLRVGRSTAEATLVHEGRISGWTALGGGLDSVAERIRQGTSPAQARSELAERVLAETRKAIMQWQRTRTVPPWIWLHGPGGDPSGEVHHALLLHSGCRVAPPSIEEPAAVGLTQHMPVLPTAVQSLSAKQLRRPKRTLQESSRAKTRRAVVVATVATVMLSGTAYYSMTIGHKARVRTDEANARRAVAEASIDHEARATAERAVQVQPVLDLLHGVSSPDWSRIFRLNERFPKDDGLLRFKANRTSTDILASACCDGVIGYTGLAEELDGWAKIIYGPGAMAQVTLDYTEKPDGSINAGATLRRPVQSQ